MHGDHHEEARMSQSEGLKTASYLLRMTPEEKAQLERKARAYTDRTGEPMTLARALREGAAALLDDGRPRGRIAT